MGNTKIIEGNCLEAMREMEENSVDLIGDRPADLRYGSA